MADIALRIKADFVEAQKAFKTTGYSAEQMASKVESMKKKFTAEHIDNFTKKMKLSSAAITATRGPMAAMRSESKTLQREIERLIKSGINPEDQSLMKLRNSYISVNKAIDKNTKKTSKSSGVMGTMLGALRSLMPMFSVFALFRIGNDAIESWRTQEAAIANVEAGLKSTGNAIGLTSMQLQTMAANIQKVGIFGDEDILQNLTAQFLTFGNIGSTNLKRIQTAATDVTAKLYGVKATGEQLKTTAIMMGKAFDNPVKGMAAMQRVGIGFSDAEKKMIKQMVAANNTIGAQNLMLKAIEKQYGGTNEALSKTGAGMERLAKNKIGDSMEQIGKQLEPLKVGFINMIASIVGGFSAWASTNNNLGKTISGLKDILIAIAAGVAVYAVATGVAALASVGFAGALGIVTGAISAMSVALETNPIGLIAVAIALVVFAIVKLVKHWDLVKFKVLDFADYATLKMLDLSIMIRQKIIGAVSALINSFANVPVLAGMFKKVSDSQKVLIGNMAKAAIAVHDRMTKRKKEYAETMKTKEAEIKKEKLLLEQTKKNIAATTNSNAKKTSQLREFLNLLRSIPQLQDDINIQEQLAAEKHFERMAQKNVKFGESKIEFLRRQSETIKSIDFKTNEQRLNAEKGLQEAIKKEQIRAMESKLIFAGDSLSLVGGMMSDVQKIMKNAGKESYAVAVVMKGIAMAEAGINSALAFTKALASIPYPLNFVAAGLTFAAGIAKQVAIATTSIPSAETGLSNYTVPDSRTNKFDGAAVMAQGGETVDISPRGQGNKKDLTVNIQIADQTIYKVVQTGIDTGQINVTDKNIGNGVFAT